MIGNNKLRKQGVADDILEVGLAHSRGVVRVAPNEVNIHSKGIALLCNGKGKHILTNELEEVCLQN